MKRVTLSIAALALSACTHHLPASVVGPVTPQPTPQPAALRAAAERVDVTLPPGVSTFGHGPDALVSEGYWTRVQCRVFALEQGAQRVAIVPCDFAASSTILQREVAARLVGIVPTTRIFMTATHTHAGPAHYFDEKAFSGTLSTHGPGFDPAVVSFLATRIADQIRSAFSHLAPAEIRSAHFDEADRPLSPSPTSGMWGLTWNRSIRPHENEGPVDSSQPPRPPKRPLDPPPPPGLEGVDAAIDPSLHWVEFRDARNQGPIGGLAFYAMHPSVLPNTNRLLGADVDGVVSRLLERRLRAQPHAVDPPVGVVNTNEGDMVPVWHLGTKEESIAVGEKIVERIDALRAPAPWRSTTTLDARYRELDVRGEETSQGFVTCRRAELGESVGYGACDHLTHDPTSPLPLPPWEPCQAPKRTPLGELEWYFAGRGMAFPSHVPIGLVRLDDSLVAFVPAEVTVNAGRQMRAAVLAEPTGAKHAFLGGLSNGYILYVTSRLEYEWLGEYGGCNPRVIPHVKGHPPDDHDRQSYEAASNLYGPSTATYLSDSLRSLAHAMTGAAVSDVDQAKPWPYADGPNRARMALPSNPPVAATRAAITTCTMKAAPGAVCFRWADAPVGDVGLTSGPWVSLVGDDGKPVVGSLGPVDDFGFDFVTRVGSADAKRSEWTTLFHVVDADEAASLGGRRVNIDVRGAGAQVRSTAFSLTAPPAQCTRDEETACGTFNDDVPERPYVKGWH